MIVATAGHVDHGKTTLVKALTGTDTDRLPEEKTRGLSIDLGFAYQRLSDKTTLGFVDVPGHEKFIRNMLSGVGGIDLGLLVVAADDGVMPQTREHFSILQLLGIDQCIVAITKVDRVNEQRMQEVKQEVDHLLRHTHRIDAVIYPVCAPERKGLGVLQEDLQSRAENVHARSPVGCFRMAIDRVFTLKGIGLVVTGMVFSGETHLEDSLMVSSAGSPVRVRGIRSLNQESDRATAGERCAINIVGRGVNEHTVKRGDWLMHERQCQPTQRIDVELQVLSSESKSLKHWTPVHLHIAADHVTARVAVLSGGRIEPGTTGLAQLVVDKDVFVVSGDRFVLRDQSARRTIAGGHVVDPFSPRRGRSRPARMALLQAMNQMNCGDALRESAALSENGIPLQQFAVSHNVSELQLEEIVGSSRLVKAGDRQSERVFEVSQWRDLLNRIEQVVGAYHIRKPMLPGASYKDIQLALKPYVELDVIQQACAVLVNGNRLGRRGPHVHLLSHTVVVSDHDRKLWNRAAEFLAPRRGSPLSLHQAAETMGVSKSSLEKSLKNAVKVGEMVLIAKNRYVPRRYLVQLGFEAERVAEHAEDAAFTVPGYCKHTQTGRNFAIDLLEYFDRLGFTERVDNARRIKRSAESVFKTR
ncbi:MAG: selenocysteine-specific translation elongation factor [Acidiferrobacterales bacterium]|nr:selenocysteine-specific translation elongation factor [Acidiferrobacterales bacterium]